MTNLSLFCFEESISKILVMEQGVISRSSFIYFIPQNNLIGIKLLHDSALRSQAEFNHKFLVVIVSLIYCHPRTFSVLDTECCYSPFSRKKCHKSFYVEIFKQIISTNIFFLMHLMQPLNFRIAPANITLPFRYLTKLIYIPYPFLWPYWVHC